MTVSIGPVVCQNAHLKYSLGVLYSCSWNAGDTKGVKTICREDMRLCPTFVGETSTYLILMLARLVHAQRLRVRERMDLSALHLNAVRCWRYHTWSIVMRPLAGLTRQDRVPGSTSGLLLMLMLIMLLLLLLVHLLMEDLLLQRHLGERVPRRICRGHRR